MSDRPIIVQISSQRCVGYRNINTSRTVSIIENVGVDATGQKWRYYSEHIRYMTDSGMYISMDGDDYGYQTIAAKDE